MDYKDYDILINNVGVGVFKEGVLIAYRMFRRKVIRL